MRAVLLPGLDGTGELYRSFVEAAPRFFSCEVVRLPSEPLSYPRLVELLVPTLDMDGETLLIAESFSGPLAITLAERTTVRAVVLCNSFVLPPRGVLARALLPHLVARVRIPWLLLRWFLVGAGAPDGLSTQVTDVVRALPPSLAAARLREVLHVDVSTALSRSRVPVLYLRGNEDRLVTESSVSHVRRIGGTMVSVASMRGPHLLLQAKPRECWRRIEEFLETVRTGTRSTA